MIQLKLRIVALKKVRIAPQKVKIAPQKIIVHVKEKPLWFKTLTISSANRKQCTLKPIKLLSLEG